jgi:hypothetical protein
VERDKVQQEYRYFIVNKNIEGLLVGVRRWVKDLRDSLGNLSFFLEFGRLAGYISVASDPCSSILIAGGGGGVGERDDMRKDRRCHLSCFEFYNIARNMDMYDKRRSFIKWNIRIRKNSGHFVVFVVGPCTSH